MDLIILLRLFCLDACGWGFTFPRLMLLKTLTVENIDFIIILYIQQLKELNPVPSHSLNSQMIKRDRFRDIYSIQFQEQ
jgi:hypothetical protein